MKLSLLFFFFALASCDLRDYIKDTNDVINDNTKKMAAAQNPDEYQAPDKQAFQENRLDEESLRTRQEALELSTQQNLEADDY